MAIWLVKAGFEGSIADKFKTENTIAIGWYPLGNFPIEGDWEKFRAEVKKNLPPDYSAQRVGSAAGQLWSFSRVMEIGDFVISPIKQSREVLVGKVTGPYRFAPDFDEEYPRTRSVQWFTPMPWDSVPPELRSSFSQWLTICQPSVDFTPVIERSRKRDTTPIPTQEFSPTDPVESSVVEDLAERAEELVRQMLVKMHHSEFQRFVGGVFQATGFTVLYDSSGRGRDGGIDLLLSRDTLGAGEKIVVQVKHEKGPVSQPDMQQLLGTLRPGEWGLMVSLGGINSNTERYWRENRDRLLKPIESSDLVKLIQEHYEKLSDEFRVLLPLRRTYVPVPREVTE